MENQNKWLQISPYNLFPRRLASMTFNNVTIPHATEIKYLGSTSQQETHMGPSNANNYIVAYTV